mmetsp:Transcript_5337/g.11308  ORF Transcript_5337/g.11308 Transcript_5337/m.11308 type:complete len:101 (-) Transcript_5337:251-553(-)
MFTETLQLNQNYTQTKKTRRLSQQTITTKSQSTSERQLLSQGRRRSFHNANPIFKALWFQTPSCLSRENIGGLAGLKQIILILCHVCVFCTPIDRIEGAH